ncbi:hypothetical protein Esi_0100_0046 [Ectocarpus siliculosus]|uniref:Uncharacterized protein n=1 Tax=Ectocarpus siliculosus TaxID=2880 RepID=D8LCA6_ECTSI|nr:hypothetical protein Esi_0100_0046 [Ectocarpus siliculosus]|eukprot:CBN78142.1 hypothetical protein Esi_0100_0046 [Ectocarpus siliculosus]
MHLNKVRSPHYHRTQYLSNLGIWAKKEAKHLNSSRQTEARYKSNLTPEAAVAAKKNPSSTTTTTPGEPSPVPPPRPPGTPSDEALLAAATSRTAGSARPHPAAGEAAAVSEVVPSESPRPQPAPRSGGHDHPRRQEEEETGSPPSEASGGGSGGEAVPPQPTSTGAGGKVGVVAAAVGASSLAGEALDGEEGGQDTAVVAAAAVAVAVTAPARSQPSAGAATAAPPASAAGTADSLGATDSSADDSSTTAAVPAATQRRNEQISPSSAAAPVPAASTPAAAIIPPLPGAPAAAQPTSSSSSPSSHRLRSARTVADPLKVGSPPLRAVRPPRRDIRRDYLTNLGMKRAVVAGPGDARTPPPMIRRSSFIESVENPVEEQLKDPNAGEITLEGVLRVVGSILTGGNSTKKEREPRPCRTCERLRAGNSSGSSANSSPTVGWHGGAQDCRGGKGRRGVQGSGGGEGEGSVVEFAPCRHKHVDFAPVVSAVYVPVHSEYSDRVRRSYWNSAGEIREMVYRNMIEFDAEEYNWENVAEEEDMYFCEETGEFIHPIFFDSQEEAREVRATSSSATSSSDRDGEEHVEYINEGRGLPVMQQR